jgi:hypothetical protein
LPASKIHQRHAALCLGPIDLPKSKKTRVGDLCLDKGSAVKLILGTNFQSNGVGALGVPNSLTTSLNIRAYAVVVRGRENGQGVGGVNGNSILGSSVTEGGVVAGNLAIQNIVGNFTTSKETIVTNNSVDVEVGLRKVRIRKSGF